VQNFAILFLSSAGNSKCTTGSAFFPAGFGAPFFFDVFILFFLRYLITLPASNLIPALPALKIVPLRLQPGNRPAKNEIKEPGVIFPCLLHSGRSGTVVPVLQVWGILAFI
jgi:hypothetical protein